MPECPDLSSGCTEGGELTLNTMKIHSLKHIAHKKREKEHQEFLRSIRTVYVSPEKYKAMARRPGAGRQIDYIAKAIEQAKSQLTLNN